MRGHCLYAIRPADRRSLALFASIVLATALSTPAARAEMKLDGDTASMKLMVTDVPRDGVVSELARTFGIEIAGRIVAGEDPVTGNFRGDIGDVLARVLVSNNFLIVYEGGKPAKVLLSERGDRSMPVDPSMRMLQPGGGTGLGGGQFIDHGQPEGNDPGGSGVVYGEQQPPPPPPEGEY